MTKTERIKAALAMEPTDVIPYSLWSHLPEIDMDPVALAQATYDFYKRLDIDFIKTMNNGMYPIEDLGCVVDYSEIAKGGVARLIDTPIKTMEDWDKITVSDINKGALARELHSLELLLEKVKNDDVPVIFTVFSPLTTADKLSGKHLLEHIKNGGGEKIHRALEAIAKTTRALAEKAIEMGAAGVFYATQMSDYIAFDEALYREYGVPYDLKILSDSKGWFNVLHV
ncbi:MAG: uroporphyrinogen decarboxylase family protein, partial [Oscillospiraceae bacterium]